MCVSLAYDTVALHDTNDEDGGERNGAVTVLSIFLATAAFSSMEEWKKMSSECSRSVFVS